MRLFTRLAVFAAIVAMLVASFGQPAEAGRYKAPAPATDGRYSVQTAGDIDAESTSKQLISINAASPSGDPKIKYCSTLARCDDYLFNYVAAGGVRTTLRYALDGPNWKTVYDGTDTRICYGGGYHVLPLAVRQRPQVFVYLEYGACRAGKTMPKGTPNAGQKVERTIYVGADARAKYVKQ